MKRNSLPDLKGTLLSLCDHYLLGKHHRISFSHAEAKQKIEILGLVHFDICGPMNVKSFGGALYFVTFIDDDASRKVWSFTMKSRDQVLEIFQKFHIMVERQTSKPLKTLYTNNGEEYISKRFEEYCEKYGIRHEKTIPYTP